MMKMVATTLVILFFVPFAANLSSVKQVSKPETDVNEAKWVAEQFSKLSDDERLGQLMMLGVWPEKGREGEAGLINNIKKYGIGGVIVFKGHPTQIASITNRLQKEAKIPLLMAIDGEWGASMRVDSIIRFPRQLLLGAMQKSRYLYDMGKEIAFQCRRLGIHVNFAPVVDVNNNPNNPVINDRSFGEDRYNVAAKSFLYMMGMQDHNVMACAKHFPGHGDTDVDSHKDLPVIMHDRNRLDSIELFPFKVLMENGLQSTMIAHLNIPSLDNTVNLPSTLSKPIVTGLLREKLGYKGLAITDAMNMHGVTKYFPSGEADAKALVAGNDILLMSQDVPAAFKAIKKAIADGEITWEEIYRRCKKVLRAKYRLGLNNYKPVDLKNVVKDINRPSAKVLKRNLIENALTLAKNKDELLPLRRIDNLRFASLSIGRNRKTTFQRSLDQFATVKHFFTSNSIASSISKTTFNNLKNYNVVFVSLHNMSKYASKGFGVSESAKDLIQKLSKETKVVLIVFGSPYSLKYFDNNEWVLEAYDEDKITQELAAQALFGATKISGKLPVTASKSYSFGEGFETAAIRMRRTIPEAVGMSSQILNSLEHVVYEALDMQAAPGCQILIARKGSIIYHKAFGYHTYNKQKMVRPTDVYDVASITKVAATTLSLMRLYDENKLDVNESLATYLPELKGSNKANMKVKEVLAHQAGLISWIPFYKNTLNSNQRPAAQFYRNTEKEEYKVKVTDNLYMHQSYVDSIWYRIVNSSVRSDKNYKYSDLGFYLFARMIKTITKEQLDDYARLNFYEPMNLWSTTFKPLEKKVRKEDIVPSELDAYFRHQEVKGHVHDMGAAMLGGVSGHAGLFSNGNDLISIFQMLLNGGQFMGKRYLMPETVNLFSRRYSNNYRRGMGFDKPEVNGEVGVSKNTAFQASPRTFGHTGFTGTAVWADPEHELVFVFLSNRTYPTMNNRKLLVSNIRTRIHEIVYQSIKENRWYEG